MRKVLLGLILPLLAFGASGCQVSSQSGNEGAPVAEMSGGGGSVGSGAAVANPAMTAPDQTAWNLFIEAVKPGSGGSTFETWPTDADTFVPGAQAIGGNKALLAVAPRPSLHAPVIPSMRAQLPSGQGGRTGGNRHGLTAGMALAASGEVPNPPPPGPSIGPDGKRTGCDSTQSAQTFEPGCGAAKENVRRNPAAYNFIVNNHLNTVSGLRKAYQSNVKVDFPPDAIEIKMNWLPVSALGTYYPGVSQDQFYLSDLLFEGKKVKFALIAMHVISKQVPNWTWATFEHQANRGRCDFLGCHDTFGAVNPNVAPVNDAKGANQGTVYPACTKTQALLDAFKAAGVAAVFNNYCLKGSQTDFTDNNGLAVRVGNSVTEATFVPQASCMTCHGIANFTSAGQSTSGGGFFPDGDVGYALIGSIDPIFTGYWKLSGAPPTYPPYQGMSGLVRNALSADFVWSIPLCAYNDVNDPKLLPGSRCKGK
jgi:hypothetical protein